MLEHIGGTVPIFPNEMPRNKNGGSKGMYMLQSDRYRLSQWLCQLPLTPAMDKYAHFSSIFPKLDVIILFGFCQSNRPKNDF